MRTRKLEPPDRGAIERILRDDETFNDEEIRVAMEVLDDAIASPGGDYHGLVAHGDDGAVLAYIIYGRTPMTDGTWDLYWLATHPEARGQGLGRALVRAMEAEIVAWGQNGGGVAAATVRVETSQLESYGAARAFYERVGYTEVGRIRDFYRAGDDLVIFARRLETRARAAADNRGRAAVEQDRA